MLTRVNIPNQLEDATRPNILEVGWLVAHLGGGPPPGRGIIGTLEVDLNHRPFGLDAPNTARAAGHRGRTNQLRGESIYMEGGPIN
eukprot:1675438-Pyramimonas_sp.AAC.1